VVLADVPRDILEELLPGILFAEVHVVRNLHQMALPMHEAAHKVGLTGSQLFRAGPSLQEYRIHACRKQVLKDLLLAALVRGHSRDVRLSLEVEEQRSLRLEHPAAVGHKRVQEVFVQMEETNFLRSEHGGDESREVDPSKSGTLFRSVKLQVLGYEERFRSVKLFSDIEDRLNSVICLSLIGLRLSYDIKGLSIRSFSQHL
jgi:hypothetical protein